MGKAVILEESLFKGLRDGGTKLGSLELGNLTQHLGEVVGIDLKPMDKSVVHVPTRDEYDVLMKVYEAVGRRWHGNKLPTSFDYWKECSKNTCISNYRDMLEFSPKDFYEKNGYDIFTPNEYYERQEVSLGQIGEIVALHDCVKGLLAKRG